MTLNYSYVREKYELNLRADGVTHQVELGASATGNITKIDNMLEKIPERLESTKKYLADLEKQLENSKEELGRPFPQAEALKEKSARLAELDILLSMDVKSGSREEPENEEQDNRESESSPIQEENLEEAVGFGEPETPRSISPKVGQRVIFHAHEGNGHVVGEVIETSDTEIVIRSGALTIPVWRDKGTFAEAPELDKTQTLEYAQELARQHTGTDGMVFVAGGERTYNGPVVEMTPTFLIQEVEKGVAVLHRLKDLGQGNETKLQKGQNVVINKEAGKVMVSVDCDQNSWGNNVSMER